MLMTHFGGTTPDPVVVSPTIQEFRGERYWLHDRYYVRQLKGRRTQTIHREVWSATYGNIPHGWHVHHLSEDRTDNRLTNLVAIAPRDHVSNHVNDRRTDPKWRNIVLSNFAKGRKQPRPTATFICHECGREYEARPSYGLRINKCCSAACHNRAYRRRLKEAANG